MKSTHLTAFDEAIQKLDRAQSDMYDAGTNFAIQETQRLSRRYPLRTVTMVSCMGHLDIHISTKGKWRLTNIRWKDYSFDAEYRTIHDRTVEALSWLDKIVDFEMVYDFIPVISVRVQCVNGVITRTDYEW